MSSKKLRIALIGCGGIAHQKHIPSLKANEELCELVYFCDIIPERARLAAEEFGTKDAKWCVDYHDVLKDESIDVVHVLTPNVSHCAITVDAFAAGKHVMCEKPMAHTSSDAQKMMDAWKVSGKKFTVGYQNRFRAEVQSLHTACRQNELGDIYLAKAHAIRRRGVPTWGVFPNKALQGGGPLIDIGTHALDMTLWMMDNYQPKSVTGSVFYKLGSLQQATEGNVFGPWDPQTFEVEDSAFGFIKMENGATIILEASWAINLMESREAATTLCGTKAGAEIRSGMSFPQDELYFNRGHNGLLTDETAAKSGAVAYFKGSANAPGTLEAKQWLQSVLTPEREPLVMPQQAFVVTKILEAIYQSAQSGKEVFL